MLLNIVRGCTSFEDVRIANEILHDTFKSACYAFGLLQEDRQWVECIQQAATWAMDHQLRQLFATILQDCELTNPPAFW